MSAEPVQTTLFGVAAPLGVHRVAAHSRQLQDGTSVYVAEHVRWNRGRSATPPPRVRTRVQSPPEPEQLALFSMGPAKQGGGQR